MRSASLYLDETTTRREVLEMTEPYLLYATTVRVWTLPGEALRVFHTNL